MEDESDDASFDKDIDESVDGGSTVDAEELLVSSPSGGKIFIRGAFSSNRTFFFFCERASTSLRKIDFLCEEDFLEGCSNGGTVIGYRGKKICCGLGLVGLKGGTVSFSVFVARMFLTRLASFVTCRSALTNDCLFAFTRFFTLLSVFGFLFFSFMALFFLRGVLRRRRNIQLKKKSKKYTVIAEIRTETKKKKLKNF